jgi:polyisoprenoid-binding protein YceI
MNKKVFIGLLLFALATFAFYPLRAQEETVKLKAVTAKSNITYAMNHPLHAWKGVSKDFTSVIVFAKKSNAIRQVAVVAKVASFDSQNANRDSHAMEATEALKFPNITFTSTSIEEAADGKLKVKGEMSFHGVKKEITFDAVKKVKGGTVTVTGNFVALMSEFGIPAPSLMAMSTDDDIKVNFEVVYE